ncbi:MAG: Asd/ArgC dimerization domain-containing protein [Myxococcota bacterium]|nr:Asd/ArgC dimerization domain-containing protein [Myxococcota bacterium]
MRDGLRVGVVGATGLLGQEVIAYLDEEQCPVGELQVFAGEDSLGQDVEFRGESLPVQPPVESLRGLDALVLCTPAVAALDWVRIALRSEVACIDCSGALVGSVDVPMAMTALGAYEELASVPLISSPPGAGLAWGPVLAAVQREAGLQRVLGTVLHSASAAGRHGIETLSEETLALLNQRSEEGEPVRDVNAPRAFECHAHGVDSGKGPEAILEGTLVDVLRRVLGPDVTVAATSIQVPTFAGQGSTLALQTEKPLRAEEASVLFEKTPGVEVVEEARGLGTRESVGGETIQISRIRADPTTEAGRGILLWLTADPLRLAARNAIRLIEARFPQR